MNAKEWLDCTDPDLMLQHLGHHADSRKMRLYACAWAYDLWHLLSDDRSREAVIVAERFADGKATDWELATAFYAAQDVWTRIPLVRGGRHGKGSQAAKHAAEVARNAANPDWNARMARHCYLWLNAGRKCILSNRLRDLFGNPFRRPTPLAPSVRGWNDGMVVQFARSIYDGYLFEDMPILADALDDAGCTDADLVAHLRGPNFHCRGCWGLDLLLAIK